MTEQQTTHNIGSEQRTGILKESDPLLRLIGVVAVVLVLLVALAFVYRDKGPVVVLPWFIPMMNGFLVLVATCVAFLAFGRHRVLGESASFWVGVGFSAFAVGMLFNVLTWPALLPDGSSILGDVSNTAAWVATVGLQILGISLLMAVLVPWPAGPRWTAHTSRWVIAGWLAFLLALNLLFVVYEDPWPRIASADGRFLPIHVVFSGVGLGLETAAGAILSTLRYRRRRDTLFGHVTICQLTLLNVAVFTAMQDRRFDTWWYVQRALWAAGFLTMLFGLLFEYVELFRREQERSAELAVANRELARLKAGLETRVQERTAQLLTANQELESFAYTVSHDLRAPLRHLMVFSSFLQERMGAGFDEKNRQYLRFISEGAERMDRLTEDLLRLSRIDRTPLQETEVRLERLVVEAREELATATEGRQIEWQVGPLLTVLGDPGLLRSVLVNLLENAVKYTRSTSPERIEVGSERRNGEVVFFVRDNGAGFDMKHVKKLFRAFQRLHPSDQFQGTGIGLASVRRIIQRHGGRVWAEGAVGQGATFYFSLPADRYIENDGRRGDEEVRRAA